MCIKVSVKFDVKETMIEPFIRILESEKKNLPSVEGCLGYWSERAMPTKPFLSH